MGDFLPERNLVQAPGVEFRSHTYDARYLGLLATGPVELNIVNTEVADIGASLRPRTIQSIGEGVGREVALPDEDVIKLVAQDYPKSFYPSLAVYKFWQTGKKYTDEQVQACGGDIIEWTDPDSGQEYKSHLLNTRLRTIGRNDAPHHIEYWGAVSPYNTWAIVRRVLAVNRMNVFKELQRSNFPKVKVPDISMDKDAYVWYLRSIKDEESEAA